MSDKPTAKSSYHPRTGPVAEAEGEGASAAAGKLETRAQGSVAAAVSLEGGAGTIAVPTEAQLAEFRRQVDEFPDEYRDAIQACLTEISRTQVELAHVKDAVDDVWARFAAADLRRSSPMVEAAKGVLIAAVKIGAGVALKGLLPIPKVP